MPAPPGEIWVELVECRPCGSRGSGLGELPVPGPAPRGRTGAGCSGLAEELWFPQAASEVCSRCWKLELLSTAPGLLCSLSRALGSGQEGASPGGHPRSPWCCPGTAQHRARDTGASPCPVARAGGPSWAGLGVLWDGRGPVAQGFGVPRGLGWQGLQLPRGSGYPGIWDGRGSGWPGVWGGRGLQGHAGSYAGRTVGEDKAGGSSYLHHGEAGSDGGDRRASANWGSPPCTATSPTLGELCFRPTFSLRSGLTGREKHPWALLSAQPGAGPAAGAWPAVEAHAWHTARRRARLCRESAVFYTHLALVEVMAGGGGEWLCGCGRLRCCRDVCACGDGDFRAC